MNWDFVKTLQSLFNEKIYKYKFDELLGNGTNSYSTSENGILNI